jgi:hypothetical protein
MILRVVPAIVAVLCAVALFWLAVQGIGSAVDQRIAEMDKAVYCLDHPDAGDCP